MKTINEYTVSIIVVSLLAIILEHLLPEGGSKKYTGVIIGLFVMLVILNPLTKLPHYEHTFTIPQIQPDDAITTSETPSFITETFEKNLAQTVITDIRDTYQTEVDCRIRCDVNESGQIIGIRKLTLSPCTPDISKYISEKYDIEEAKITQ